MNNLIAPLQFSDGDVDQFIKRRRCWCGGHLLKIAAPGPEHNWKVKCPEHGFIMQDTHISASKAERMKSDVIAASLELSTSRHTLDELENFFR